MSLEPSPSQVWTVLTDFEAMPGWSSTFKGMSGDISDGAEVDVVYVVGDTTYDLKHTIGYKEGEYYSWSDPTVAGMKDNHYFRVEQAADNKTLFVHTDETIGGVAWLAGGHMLNLERTSFRTFNAELKAEVERRVAAGDFQTQGTPMENADVNEIGSEHHQVYTDIIIDADIATVWAVLTDFENMPSWSPNFKGMSGDIRDGGEVLTVFDIGQGDETIPVTLILEDGVAYGWSSNMGGIQDNHRYRVEVVSGKQTRFVQTDEFTGSAEGMTTADIAGMVLEPYQAFNRALKAQVEQ